MYVHMRGEEEEEEETVSGHHLGRRRGTKEILLQSSVLTTTPPPPPWPTSSVSDRVSFLRETITVINYGEGQGGGFLLSSLLLL